MAREGVQELIAQQKTVLSGLTLQTQAPSR